MAIQVLELELTENIKALPVDTNYDFCRILIRHYQKPLGWIIIPVGDDVIMPEVIKDAVKQQLSFTIIQHALQKDLKKATPVSTRPISIVVCTRNRTQLLAGCLEALLALQYPQYEIIVVDNAPSNDDTFNLVSTLPVRYVREDLPGLDRARNKGIAEAKHDIIAYTDDDARVDANWLQAIATTFEDDDVDAVTGFVAPAELNTQAQSIFELGYGGMGHGFVPKVYKKELLTERQLLWASTFGVGANMAFRKSIFKKIGLFDVAFDVGTPSRGGGDIEMFHRVVHGGGTLVYNPSVLIWHKHRQTIGELHKQIADNGCSFGCYLIHCYKTRTINRSSIIKFLIFNWLIKWNLKNLIKPPKRFSRYLTLLELKGMLSSPFAYRATKKWAKALDTKHHKLSLI